MRTPNRLMSRLVAGASALAVGLTGAVVLTTAPAQARTVLTDYGLQSTAFGTRVISNNVSLNAGRTAFAWISCTRLAGVNKDNSPNAANYLAASNTPKNNPWVQLGAVTSDNRSFRKDDGDIVGITATNKIASLTLTGPAESEGATVPLFRLEGLTTKATAYAKNDRFHAETLVTSADVDLQLPAETPIDAELEALLGAVNDGIGAVLEVIDQTDDNAIDIPGLGVLRLGYERVAEYKNYASAAAYTLRVQLAGADGAIDTDDDSEIQVGRSRARINRNLPAGVMNGYGYALDLSAADELLSIGRTGLQVLPCQGTNGEIRGVTVPAQDILDGAVDLGAMHGLVYGIQRKDGTGSAWTKGKVSEIALGSGDERLEIRGIVGVAKVRKTESGKIIRSIKGSTIGSLTVGTETFTSDEIPTDPIVIDGLGKVEFFLKEKNTRGIKVTAVRITLDPGESSETVINLGNARTMLKKA